MLLIIHMILNSKPTKFAAYKLSMCSYPLVYLGHGDQQTILPLVNAFLREWTVSFWLCLQKLSFSEKPVWTINIHYIVWPASPIP